MGSSNLLNCIPYFKFAGVLPGKMSSGSVSCLENAAAPEWRTEIQTNLTYPTVLRNCIRSKSVERVFISSASQIFFNKSVEIAIPSEGKARVIRANRLKNRTGILEVISGHAAYT